MSQQALEIDMEERRVTRTVNVELTITEQAQCMKDFNQLRDEMDEEERQFTKIKDQHKAKLTDLETVAEKARLRAKNGEQRNEECVEKRFFSTNTVQVWFGDKLIEERAMTPQERQGDILDPPIDEPQHGVVSEGPDETYDQAQDIADVMAEERRADKPSTLIQ